MATHIRYDRDFDLLHFNGMRLGPWDGKEARVLAQLAKTPNRVVSETNIARFATASSALSPDDVATGRQAIKRLRQKLEGTPLAIVRHGKGYALCERLYTVTTPKPASPS